MYTNAAPSSNLMRIRSLRLRSSYQLTLQRQLAYRTGAKGQRVLDSSVIFLSRPVILPRCDPGSKVIRFRHRTRDRGSEVIRRLKRVEEIGAGLVREFTPYQRSPEFVIRCFMIGKILCVKVAEFLIVRGLFDTV